MLTLPSNHSKVPTIGQCTGFTAKAVAPKWALAMCRASLNHRVASGARQGSEPSPWHLAIVDVSVLRLLARSDRNRATHKPGSGKKTPVCRETLLCSGGPLSTSMIIFGGGHHPSKARATTSALFSSGWCPSHLLPSRMPSLPPIEAV